jgi:hypothetical protein
MHFILVAFLLIICSTASAQFEFSTGIAGNKNDAIGPALHGAYDIRVKGKFFYKPQVGFKRLSRFNDFVGAKIRVSTWEVHQTFSYEFRRKDKYIFKPNVGFNYRWYYWQGEMIAPLNTLPIRGYTIEFRDDAVRLESIDGEAKKTYRTSNFGLSIQLQNQYRLNKNLWFHITLFMEPDYDGIQNTGGCYVGVIFKKQ